MTEANRAGKPKAQPEVRLRRDAGSFVRQLNAKAVVRRQARGAFRVAARPIRSSEGAANSEALAI